MSDVITVPGRTISTVTAEIRCLTVQGQHIALTYAVEIGKRLLEAKELVPAGEWGDYLKNEVEYSSSTAHNFMQLYKEYGEAGKLADFQTFGNLTYSKALKLLALPGEDREEFVQQNDVDKLSVRQLDQLIKERDEAKQAQQAASADAETWRATARKAENQLNAMQPQIDKLTASLKTAEAAAEKAKKALADLAANPKIPDSVLSKLKAEAEENASEELRAQRDAAKQEAHAAQQKLASAEKASQLSSPDATAFKLLFDQVQQDFNKLNGYLLKIKAVNPELAAKLQTATLAVLDNLRKAVE